jgi:hypothetical protein
VRCRDATARSCVTKVRGKVFAHFHAFDVKVTEVCGIDCLAYQDEFFVNNPFGVKENNEHVLECAFHLSRLFLVWVSLNLPCTAHAFFPERLLIIVRVSAARFPRFAQNLTLFLCRVHSEIASGEIHDSK